MSKNSQEFDRLDRAQFLLEELEERRGRGEAVSLEELIASEPDLEVELRQLASACLEVEGGFSQEANRARGAREEFERLLQAISLPQAFSERYAIESELGKGGMGVVYRITDRKLARPLAMKVILGQVDVQRSGNTPPVSPRQLGRFLNEARITSQLDHPGIVPVHEVGVDMDGRAFFTMKLVKGVTLAEIFDRRAANDPEWSMPRVLGVIQRVCEAMSFAHDRVVIHRDLKPANVMVGDFGEVYVMDWGLARRIGEADALASEAAIVDEALGAQLSATRDGTVLGTPAFMSPEQARGETTQMGAPSDVYSIGAMLYQLIAGTPPYVIAGETTSGARVLERLASGPPTTLESRTTPPELIAICNKAMARDPLQRYAGVRELADDLQRFLSGRAVRAFATGAWVELGKWVARNKSLAAAVVLVVALLVGGFSVSLVYKARADDRAEALLQAYETIRSGSEELARAVTAAESRRNEAEASKTAALSEKAAAEKSAEETRLVADFQSRMLSTLPIDEFGHAIVVELNNNLRQSLESLGRSEVEIEHEQATLKSTLQSVNPTSVAQRLLERAFFERAVGTIESEFGEKPLLAAMLQTPLAETLQKLSLFSLGERLARAAVEARRVGLGDAHPDTLVAMSVLGGLLQCQGEFSEADLLYREVLASSRSNPSVPDTDRLAAISNFALLLIDEGQPSQAEALLREALEGSRAALGETDPRTLQVMNNLATLLHDQGADCEAEALLRDVVASRRATPAEKDRATDAAMNNLGVFLISQSKFAEAEELFREILVGNRSTLGDRNAETMSTINNLAGALSGLHKYSEAELLLREAVRGTRAALGDAHPDTLTFINNLASALREQGEFSEAESLLQEAVAVSRARFGDDNALTLLSISTLGSVFFKQGRLSDTEPLWQELVSTSRARLGDEDPTTQRRIRNLLSLYERLQTAVPAAGYDRRAAEMRALLRD